MKPLAVVTGASSGIGEVFARKLSARGYRLLLIARRRDRLDKLAAGLGDAEVLPADLTSDVDLTRVEVRLRSSPDLDLLVNSAGFGSLGRFWEADLAGQDAMHRVHVLAIVRLTHAALGGMVARRRGGVINVSSVAGFLQNPFNVSYCASKAWINSFTEGLYLELKSIGSPVRVQALCPGFTYSEFHDVLGVDRGTIAKRWWMPAEFVVKESLAGLEKGSLFVIPGWRYRLLVNIERMMPRWMRHWAGLKWGGRNRRARERQGEGARERREA